MLDATCKPPPMNEPSAAVLSALSACCAAAIALLLLKYPACVIWPCSCAAALAIAPCGAEARSTSSELPDAESRRRQPGPACDQTRSRS